MRRGELERPSGGSIYQHVARSQTRRLTLRQPSLFTCDIKWVDHSAAGSAICIVGPSSNHRRTGLPSLTDIHFPRTALFFSVLQVVFGELDSYEIIDGT